MEEVSLEIIKKLQAIIKNQDENEDPSLLNIDFNQHPNEMLKRIITVFSQKDKYIRKLEEETTKQKRQEIKNNTLIRNLQEKITKIQGIGNNTASTFMLPSEFKSFFEEFITTDISGCLSPLIEKCNIYKNLFEEMIKNTYQKVQGKVQKMLTEISLILHLEEFQKDTEEFKKGRQQLMSCLLKILQQNWEKVFPFQFKGQICLTKCREENELKKELHKDSIDQINFILQSEEYKETSQRLHKICVYMILQEKPWIFETAKDMKTIQYNKKQQILIDGWLKQGEPALVILEGLKRDGHFHANIKNYVIAYKEDDIEQDQNLKFNFFISHLEEERKINQSITLKEQSEKREFNQNLISKENKEILIRIETWQQKNQIISQKNDEKDEFTYHESSPKLKIKRQKIKKQDESSIKRKRSERDLMKDSAQKIQLLKDQIYTKKKSLNLNAKVQNLQQHHSIQDLHFEEQCLILASKHIKKYEDFPLSKELHEKKRIKANTSRKSSIGKICAQNSSKNQYNYEKQNYPLNPQKSLLITKQNKQRANYKDLIKQKLMLEDKSGWMMEKSISLIGNNSSALNNKSKNQKKREKEKDKEDRPLKISTNANKLREKYLI